MNNRILIIDDEASVRDLLGSYLKGNGFSVATASSGEEALRECRKEKFDLITLDLVLPDFDGLDLLTAIRKLNPEQPIILATGNEPTKTLIEAAQKRGASGFASKTAPLEKLLEQIQTLIGSK